MPRRASDSRRSGGEPRSTAAASIPKLQRWIDLIAALLSRRYPATFDELAHDVPAYRQGQSAQTLERMFERDKDELRAFGVPIETVVVDRSAPEIPGYRLRRQDFYLPFLTVAGNAGKGIGRQRSEYTVLPTLAFEPDELDAVAAAAARVGSLADPYLAVDVETAVRKLALELPIDVAQTAAGERIVAERVEGKTFSALAVAVERRKLATFDYHKMGDDTTSPRTVEPYGLAFLGSNWYLVARDTGRGALRHFRLSRMRSVKVGSGRSADFGRPADFRLAAHAASRESWELGDGDVAEVIVEFRSGSGAVRAAERLGEPLRGHSRRRRFRVRRSDAFVRWLLSFGDAAVPVDPPALVESFRALARATLALYAEEA